MTDFLAYWKTYWTNYGPARAKAHVLREGYGSNSRAFFPGDNLWIVTTAEKDANRWELRQLIHSKAGRKGRAIADPDVSEFYDPSEFGDFARILKQLQFRSRTPIRGVRARIGLSLRRPRPLSDDDVAILEAFVRRRERGKPPDLSFPDAGHRLRVERAAIEQVTTYLAELGYSVVSRERENCGYDLEAKRRKQPRVLHVEVKGTSGTTPKFYLSRNEHRYMLRGEWRLALVTSALSTASVEILTRQEVARRFLLSPLAWMAEEK